MNKKKIIGFLAVIVIAVMAAVNLNVNNSQTENLSDLSLANVEALAGENMFCLGNYCNYKDNDISCEACCEGGRASSCSKDGCKCS